MKNIRTFHWAGLALPLALACSSRSPETSQDPNPVGEIGMELTIAPGITLTRLDWVIRNEAESTVLSSDSAGHRPWIGTAESAVRFVVGGITQGGPYTVTLTGLDSNSDSCSGTSGTFTVSPGSTSVTTVAIQCAVPGTGVAATVETGSLSVEGTVTGVPGPAVTCPGISEFSVSPTVIAGDATAHLSVGTIGASPSAANWSASAGTILSPSSAQTDFSCNGYRGQVTVTAALVAPVGCQGQPHMAQTGTILCEDASSSPPIAARLPPGAPCTADAQCEAFSCVGERCGDYATTCRVLAGRLAPADHYVLDTDGSGPNAQLRVFCQTGSRDLPPVGLCQAEVGAQPACRSYMGAVGYDFSGVDFGGPMGETGTHVWQGQAVPVVHDILELSDHTILTDYPAHSGLPYRFPLSGSSEQFGTNIYDGWGLVQLFDGRVLVGGGSLVAAIAPDESSQTSLATTASLWPIQTQSGRILLPSRSVNEVLQMTPAGVGVANTTNSAFLVTNVDSALQLADGTIIVGVNGNGSNSRIVHFDRDMSPRIFTTAPRGMTLNSDGSLSRPDLRGIGRMLQLPNGQILIAAISNNTILRLNADGSYAETFTLPGGWSSPSGMLLDHRGRLLVAMESTQRVQVISFPGCSDSRRNGTETDVDCGGACTQRCLASQSCLVNGDCASSTCLAGVCQ